MPGEVSNPETKNRYLVSSLIEEAITSSQLEGASTTRKKALEMFRSGKRPANKSEQMIFNNLRGMEFIRQNQNEPLTPHLVLDIHSEMMKGTIDDSDLGRPKAICQFANAEGEAEFLHPVIRAIVLHLWLAYDHPFEDCICNGKGGSIAPG